MNYKLTPNTQDTLNNIVTMLLLNSPYVTVTAHKLPDNKSEEIKLPFKQHMHTACLWSFDYISYTFYGNPGKFTFTIHDFITEFIKQRKSTERW